SPLLDLPVDLVPGVVQDIVVVVQNQTPVAGTSFTEITSPHRWQILTPSSVPSSTILACHRPNCPPQSSWISKESIFIVLLPELCHRLIIQRARVEGEGVEDLRDDFRGLLEVLGFPAALRVLAHDQISPAHPDEIVLVLPF